MNENAPLNSNAKMMSVPAAQVIVTKRLRETKSHRVEVLKQDISFNGLLQPILVQQCDLGYTLIDGAHRLAAMRALGCVSVDAYVIDRTVTPEAVRYSQAMANINREDLTKLERAEFITTIDAAWKAMNPAARHGGDRRSENVRLVRDREADENEGAILGLGADVATATGLSRRVFFECLKISKGLTDAAKIKVRNPHFENKHHFLLKLAQQPATFQEQILDLILDPTSGATTIEEALVLIEGGILRDRSERLFASAAATWGRMSKVDRRVFIETFKADFMAVAKENGWL